MSGSMGDPYDPEAIRQAGLWSGLTSAGQAMIQAGRPGHGRMGLLAGLGMGGAGFEQGRAAGQRGAMQQGLLGDQWQKARQGNQDDAAFRQSVATLPEQERLAAVAAGPAAYGAALLARQKSAQDQAQAMSLLGRLGILPGEGQGAQAMPDRLGGAPPASLAPVPQVQVDGADLPARVLLAEAGDQGPDGLAAAAHVMNTRARLTNQPLSAVVTAPHQFEGASNPARLARFSPEQVAQAQAVLAGVQSGAIPDPTGGATHFINPQLQAQMGRDQPAWARGDGTRIGGHVFYSRPEDFRPVAPQGTAMAPPQSPAQAGSIDPRALTALALSGNPVIRSALPTLTTLATHEAPETWTDAPGGMEQISSRGQRRAAPAAERAAAERTGAQTADNQNFTRADKLRTEYGQLTGDFRAIQAAHAGLTSAARDPSAASDMSLLYQFNKILDPGSVVRESEFANAARSGSLPERVQGWASRLLSGERLTPDQRADFVKQADGLLRAQRRTYDQVRQQYGSLARFYRLDPEAVMPDYTLPAEEPPKPQAPAGGGGGPGRVLQFNPATGKIE